MPMHYFTHRMKFGAIIDVSRFTISRAMIKWIPLWATRGSHLSLLPMPHNYHKKESPNDCMRENLSNIAHLFDRKNMITETIRNDDSLRKIARSSKVYESAYRTITLATPRRLSFEYTRAKGARGREKKIVQWWGSVLAYFCN